MQASTGVLLFVLVFSGPLAVSQAGPTAVPATDFPGPCRAWLFPCGKGSWVCTSEEAYWRFIFGPQPECPVIYPQTTAPPPGECRLVDGKCQFASSSLKCQPSVEEYRGNKCGPESEYAGQTESSKTVSVKEYGDYPPPNQLCLVINDSCQWYDPCVWWRDDCTNDNVCGSADEYYTYLYGPRPSCTILPSGHAIKSPSAPPGQCAIMNDRCDWYDCISWQDWCESWLCGTVYDKKTYEANPPPPVPCPAPIHPPVKPGTCKFNVSSGKCSFFPNKTECVSWIGACGASWLCGTVHEMEISRIHPPLPCPLPPRPPVKPGTCKFNTLERRCSFFPNSSNTDPCIRTIYPPGYEPTCGMFKLQWTYNTTLGQCVAFAYSPCGEERDDYNVFATQEECAKTCANHGDPCHQPIYPPGFDTSRCNALIQQWTYNSSTGQCVDFLFFPCGARVGYDVFASEEECTKTCITYKDPCKQSIYPPGYIPNCMIVQKQWTYDQTNKECVEFNFHPCGQDRDGYDVFHTEQECTQTCVHQGPCYQSIYPPDFKPSCNVLIKQWSYNFHTGRCNEFEYYACGEDRDSYNVFSTERECTDMCIIRGG